MEWIESLRSPAAEYRSTPFWSFNDRLDPNELVAQIHAMKEAGIGGFIMHARGGLLTPYMSEDWMRCAEACISEARRLGMHVWLYDENGWPSGFGGGAVVRENSAYALRWLHHAECSDTAETFPEGYEEVLGYYAVGDGGDFIPLGRSPNACPKGFRLHVVGCMSSPYYVDVMNADCVDSFIRSTYDVYEKRFGADFGGTIQGFFTDEPQFARQIPWSMVFPDEFRSEFSEDIHDSLIALFIGCHGSSEFRYRYYRMANRLITTNYSGRIFEWCRRHGVQLTGHAMLEDSLDVQMRGTAGAMPMYMHMQQPGIDWLGRFAANPLTVLQVGSVAAQTGKRFVLSEMFAMTGWDASPQDLKWIAESQFVFGVNKICQHLQGYTLRGERKRDYPPSLFHQLPWWDAMRRFNDRFARLGKILSDGCQMPDALLLHPMRSAWMAYDGAWKCEGTERLDQDLSQAIEALISRHIEFHLGDEQVLKELASVRDGRIHVGGMSYRVLFLPTMTTIDRSTLRLIVDALKEGIAVASLGGLPECIEGKPDESLAALLKRVVRCSGPQALDPLVEALRLDRVRVVDGDGLAGRILVTSREFEGMTVHYLVNRDRHRSFDVEIRIRDAYPPHAFDLDSLTVLPIDWAACGEFTSFPLHFGGAQSHVILSGPELADRSDAPRKPVDRSTIDLNDRWTVVSMSPNAITLDACRCKLDGQSVHSDRTTVHEVLEMLVHQRYEGLLNLRFEVRIDADMDSGAFDLVHEMPAEGDGDPQSGIWINGIRLDRAPIGHFVDKSFYRTPVGDLLQPGENSVEIRVRFQQTDEFYRAYFNPADVMEVERNMRTYRTELENLFLIGPMGARSRTPFREGQRNAMFTDGPFVIGRPPTTLMHGSFTEQGLLFFAGTLEVEQTIEWNGGPTLLDLGAPYAAVLQLSVNGTFLEEQSWDFHPVDLAAFLRPGKNRIRVGLTSGNRNLLGPFHLREGESHRVSPSSFSRLETGDGWTDAYAFVKFGFQDTPRDASRR